MSSSPDSDAPLKAASGGGKFAFKQMAQTANTSQQGNPALSRFKEPTPPTTFERMLPVFKIIGALVATLAITTVIAGFLPLQTAEVRIARLADASRMLGKLAASPEDYQSLQDIRGLGRTLRQDGAASSVANALMAVAALSQVNAGFVDEGLAACRYVQKEAAGSAASEVVDARHLFAVCPACKGTGTSASTPDKTLDGPSSPPVRSMAMPLRCLRCQGKGQLLSKDQVRSQYLKSISDAQLAVRMFMSRNKFLRAAIRIRRVSRSFMPTAD